MDLDCNSEQKRKGALKKSIVWLYTNLLDQIPHCWIFRFFKNFLMLAVSQWTFLLIIIVSIGEIPVSRIAGWCDMHVFNTFIIYYLFALKSCTGFIPLPAACKRPLFFYNYTCSEYFIFSLSQFGKKNVISWFYFAFVITSMNEQFYICFLPIELFFLMRFACSGPLTVLLLGYSIFLSVEVFFFF